MKGRGATPQVAAVDRHAERVAAVREAVFDSDAVTDRASRSGAASGDGELLPELAAYLANVREASYRITDEDVASLRRVGHSEEEIFELSVAAALGAALLRRDAGLRALRGGA